MKLYIHDEKNEKLLDNGVIRTVKSHIDDLMVCELKWNKGMLGTEHTHPHRQCGYIIKGSFEATVCGKKQILKAGDCFYCEKDEPHSLLCLEDGSLMLDIFTPMREDFIK